MYPLKVTTNQKTPIRRPYIPSDGKRYVIGVDESKEELTGYLTIFVVDLQSDRIVFESKCRNKKKIFTFIQESYGKTNCIPPRKTLIKYFK